MMGKGAEAELFLDRGVIAKKRKKKEYRNALLDSRLRKERTRREGKILHLLQATANTPKLLGASENNFEIRFTEVKGKLLRQALRECSEKQALQLMRLAGEQLALIHSSGVSHGDFSTSNIMVEENGRVVIIDFGLSEFSKKDEDFATDLLLFKKCIPKHLFEEFLSAYSEKMRRAQEIIQRMHDIEKRARYSSKA